MSIDEDCCEKGCEGCGKDGCAKNQCCENDGCCKDDGCRDCCAHQNQELTVSSKMIFLFRVLGSIMLIFSLIDFGISAAIGAYGFIALGWTEFCFCLVSIVAAVFALIPFNRTCMIVLFTFALTSSVLTFVGIALSGMYVETCRVFLDSDDDIVNDNYGNNNNSYSNVLFNDSICSLINSSFSFILMRFFIAIPLTVFSGLKLFGGKSLSQQEEEGPRVVIKNNPAINNATGK